MDADADTTDLNASVTEDNDSKSSDGCADAESGSSSSGSDSGSVSSAASGHSVDDGEDEAEPSDFNEDDEVDEDDEMGLEDEEEEEDEATFDVEPTPMQRKYQLLVERCQAIQQDNERLLGRICEVKHLCRRIGRERRLLMLRLDGYMDNYRNVPIIMPPNESDRRRSTGRGGASLHTLHGDKVERPKRRRSARVPRDPNMPKKPQNPFLQFCQEQRSLVRSEHLAANVTLSKKDLSKILAKRWSDLDRSEKEVYYKRFEQEKELYKANMRLYEHTMALTSNPATTVT